MGDEATDPLVLHAESMPRLATIDERYQSFNVEMLEVTGGRFWKPYASTREHAAPGPGEAAMPEAASSGTPAGMDPSIYEYRPPKDLANPRLRKLARALGPAYVRVSGTWANTVYLPTKGEQAIQPPSGFASVLTREQWRGVVDFVAATGGKLVTSFAISAGTRGADGVWTEGQAKRMVDLTAEFGGALAAAEFFNEPTLAVMGGAPAGYDAAAYGRDFRVFRTFMREQAPGVKVLGPGSVGESTDPGGTLDYRAAGVLRTASILREGGGDIDGFSYHHYGAVSQRCAGRGMSGTSPAGALSEQWLSRTDHTLAFYRSLRDRDTPGKPLWLTETAQAACGGDRWASTFIDTFRYLDQLGRLAREGVQVVMHNTLAASDYALLDEQTYAPRPNYWAAVLWSRMMGTAVLDAGVPVAEGLHIYAHGLRGRPGGVALLVLNTSRSRERSIELPVPGERFTISARELEASTVQLNGVDLLPREDGSLPEFRPAAVAAGLVSFAPATVTFIALPGARNPAAR